MNLASKKKNETDMQLLSYGDPEKTARVFFLFTGVTLVAMFAGIFILLSHGDRQEAILVALTTLPILASMYFVRRKAFEWAARFIAVLMILMITVLSTRGLGIHAISNLGYPAILIVASLVTRRRTMIFLTLVTVGCVAWLVFGELAGAFTPTVLVRSVPGDFFTAALVIIAAAFMVRQISELSFEANRKLQQELKERRKIEKRYKQLIRELEAKNAELESFTYTVSHDLKAPLITIRGFLGHLEEDVTSSDRTRLKEDVERIANATEKMRNLLDELLFLSRIGRLKNPSVDVPFGEIVREALGMVEGRLRARQIQISVAADLPVVHGDRPRLVEVVQNLIDNAAKFMTEQAEPRIEIGQQGLDADGNPILFVRDNGIGIEAQYHNKIFGLFSKLAANSEGTGVGLAIVKKIIEVHNGHIWVESEVGKGATFFFTFGSETGSG